jgi:hypothetical protein
MTCLKGNIKTMGIQIKSIITLLLIVIFWSCNSREKNITSEIICGEVYYKSGKIREIGCFKGNSDTPVGIYTSFYENGRKKTTRTIDSLGKLNGDWIEYYENGSIKLKMFFIDNIAEGYLFKNLDSFLNVQQSSFYYHNKIVGNHYQYRNSKIDIYKFYGFDQNKYLIKEYDTVGNEIRSVGTTLFQDSITVDSKKFDNVPEIKLLIANPPSCSNKIQIKTLDKGKHLIHVFNVNAKDIATINHTYSDKVKFVTIEAFLYDSISKKKEYQFKEYIFYTAGRNVPKGISSKQIKGNS